MLGLSLIHILFYHRFLTDLMAVDRLQPDIDDVGVLPMRVILFAMPDFYLCASSCDVRKRLNHICVLTVAGAVLDAVGAAAVSVPTGQFVEKDI